MGGNLLNLDRLHSQHRLRVAHVYPGGADGVGGAETQSLVFLKHCADSNVEGDLVILGRNRTLEQRAAEGGAIRIQTLGAEGQDCLHPSVLRSYRALLASADYDLVHLFGLRHEMATRWLSRVIGGCAVVSGIRGMESHRTWLQCRLNQMTARWVDLWVSNSEATRELFIARDRLAAERIVVVANGVRVPVQIPDRRQAAAELHDWLGIPPDRLVVVCVANLLPDKRQADLVLASRGLIAAGLDVDLVLAGRHGDYADTLRALAADQGISDRVHLCGYRDDVSSLLAGCDVFALASGKEGLPTAILEAMAAGLPVVATAVAEIPRVVLDGITGYVVPVGDVRALEDRLATLLRQEDLRKSLGRAGHARARAHYAEAIMVEKLVAVYRALVERRMPRP